MAEGNVASVGAYGGYQSARSQVEQDLKRARQQGYTETDLQPVLERLSAVQSTPEPLWIGDRASFYRSRMQAIESIRAALDSLEQEVLAQTRAAARQDLAGARQQIDRDQQLDLDAEQLKSFQDRYASLGVRLDGASRLSDLRAIDGEARSLAADAQKAGDTQQEENDAIRQAAAAIVQQQNGSLDAIRGLGGAALASGRNDAAVAAYEAKPGRFPPIKDMMALYSRMEHYSDRLGASDLDQVAFAAAAIQRYSARIHDLLLQNLGPKHIIVSFEAQHVWAYEGSKVVMDSPVTTGIRGDTAYGTDFGPMKVLFKSHPWTMRSPWPRGSPYWYPDTTVQWTAFFTWSGESFHDAYWEPDSMLGPGSQYNPATRSHGCIHLPYTLAQWLFSWADVGTPVDVYPGNGKPVSEQVSEMTTDDQGNPLNPA